MEIANWIFATETTNVLLFVRLCYLTKQYTNDSESIRFSPKSFKLTANWSYRIFEIIYDITLYQMDYPLI